MSSPESAVADLKPYPAYKASGVPWLGQVPEHWDVQRLKSAAAQVNEQTSDKKPDDVYVALENVEGWTGRVRLAKDAGAFDSHVKRFQPNDVLFGKLRPYLAKVARLPVKGVCVGEFLVLRSRRDVAQPCYLEHLLRSRPIIDVVNSSTFGAKMPRSEWTFVGGMPICLPPLPEQTAIARFLTHTDRQIHQYIRARQKLIKLLEEQKQAIIHQAVTRGLDPGVRLKPSGVEWLGDVPEHWEILRLGRILRVHSGDMISAGEELPDGFPIYGGNGIRGYTDKWNTEGRTILLGRVGAKCGCVHVVSGRFWASEHALRVRFLRHVNLDYLALVLRAIDFNRLAIRTAQPLINSTIVRSSFASFPQDIEQAAIVDYVRNISGENERLVEKLKSEASKLLEFRSRLIADVVTGKTDVREVGAALPAETKCFGQADEGPEPPDESSDEVDSDVESEEADA